MRAPARAAETVVARGGSTTASSEQALEDVLLTLRRRVPRVLEVVLREAVAVEGVEQLDDLVRGAIGEASAGSVQPSPSGAVRTSEWRASRKKSST